MKLNYLVFSLSLLHMSESEVELLSTQYLQFIFTLSSLLCFSPCRQNERLSLHSGPRWLLDWDPKSQQYGVHHLLKMNPCNLLQCESSGLLWVQWEKKIFFWWEWGEWRIYQHLLENWEHTEWDYLHNGNQSVQAQNGLLSHSWSAFWLPLLPQQLFSWLCRVIIFNFFKKWCARKTVILCNKHESHIWYGFLIIFLSKGEVMSNFS